MEKTIMHRLYIDFSDKKVVSPYVFGHNLEHTRACVSGGLSAQMLRNRKFAGRPATRSGVSAEWFGIGERVFYCNDQSSYVKHYTETKMRRRNDLNSQTVQNPIEGQVAGIGQGNLCLQNGKRYVIAFVVRVSGPVTIDVSLTDRTGNTVYASEKIAIESADWQRYEITLAMVGDDAEGCLRFCICERAEVVLGAVSMLPEDNFHGMRRDVVELMKRMGIGMLRWPGGNFAGEYRWQDMFLPVDQRAPLQAYMEDETQPYTHGYDMHEVDTDSFIALCREIGAEPYITVNLTWDTPEECAAWVEYCNGSTDSKYGSLRAQRGHAEPYHVRYWSLGNEMGHGHMEGPKQAENYAALCQPVAEAMLHISPELQICSSGPYFPERPCCREWLERSAAALAPAAPIISYHTYNTVRHDYTSPAGIRRTYTDTLAAVEQNREQLQQLRAQMPDGLHISYDEWNTWVEWFRSSNALQGMYVAKMLHMLISESNVVDMPIVCYFEPVGEGAIDIAPDHASFSSCGQMFSLLQVHKGAELCRVDGGCGLNAVATVQEGILSVSLINDAYEESATYILNRCGDVLSAKLLAADDLLPCSHMSERELPVQTDDDTIRVELSPRSVGLLRIAL